MIVTAGEFEQHMAWASSLDDGLVMVVLGGIVSMLAVATFVVGVAVYLRRAAV